MTIQRPPRRHTTRLLAAAALLGALSLGGTAHAATADCDALAARARLMLPQAGDIHVSAVAAGAFTPPGRAQPTGMNIGGQAALPSNPAFCRVAFTLQPSPESAIRTEVWLPLKGWNGKFIGVGNFGWGGDLPFANMVSGLTKGYAVAGNDTGHQGDGGQFLLGHPQKLEDYAWRANHLMTLRAKTLITRFYGRGAAHAYFIGCSLGGLQALIEAKRFAADYDGIVAGAPPNPLIDFNGAQMWPGWLTAHEPQSAIPRTKLSLITKAVIAQCATPVGKAQGFVDAPESCRFDPAPITCAGAEGPDCLTKGQIALLRKIYEGPKDPNTGKVIFPGPAYGSETELAPFVSGQPFRNAADLWGIAAFQQEGWNPDTIDWARDPARARKALGDRFEVRPADLKPFFARGGRLMLYVGWNDFHNPAELAGFYRKLQAQAGARTDRLRLFTVPGMNHCAGGEGCDTFSKIDVIDAWSTSGKAPSMVLTSKVQQGQVVRQRPVCAWPALTRYKGAGDPAAASSYRCESGAN
ncbi:tannase/feruloyl esterase family alpha/beta hydrolase [Novosphingobium terrae]|uniref:tannase/feruloyl esterase family alpha/beta hydrolase n=1 Tax=Novosphingobium terrae TaxID=2726189 RepID=UPI0019821C58|nr:tannase/feruloyl esterase family alpha/beta hydrolase [Novosphingobium terrae]